jgi:hypothetical protein
MIYFIHRWPTLKGASGEQFAGDSQRLKRKCLLHLRSQENVHFGRSQPVHQDYRLQ